MIKILSKIIIKHTLNKFFPYTNHTPDIMLNKNIAFIIYIYIYHAL